MGLGNFTKVFLLLYVLFVNHPAYSNDSVAGLSTGGLILLKSNQIAMLSEDLYISRDIIEVNYTFKNLTDHDITTLVAFPLPETPAEYSGDIAGGAYDENGQFIKKDFVNFQIWIEKKKIAPSLDIKKKISMNGQFKGDEVFQLTYYWKQTFPAGQTINVRHVYKARYGGVWGLSRYPSFFPDSEADKLYCYDQSFKAALYNEFKNGHNYIWGNYITYILTTGGNWADGIIRDFRLVVDKGSPNSIVSFCGNNVKKISPTKFEMRAKNYRPTNEIYILIVDKPNE